MIMSRYSQREDWLTIAKRLPLNTSTRARCCKDDKSAIISAGISGYRFYCFRCGTGHFVQREGCISVSDFAEANKVTEKLHCRMPEDASMEDIPIQGLNWLRKAGIDEDLRKEYKIQYSPSIRRVLLPSYDNAGRLLYLQARAVFEGQTPKYANQAAVKKPLFHSHQAVTSEVVLTEDILSAIKVGQVFSAISLLGTKPVDTLLPALMPFDEVFVWLDPDDAGIDGSIKIAHYCSLLGKPVYRVHSDKDPKYYSKQEIKQFIERSRSGTRI